MTPQEKANSFPSSPGVYLMKDANGRILYIGKAIDLKKRVSSYFGRSSRDRYQVQFLMKRVADLEYVVTDNEKEALLLENTLIKKHTPKYNIQLRDDKSYISLKLSVKDRFPRLYVTRDIRKDDSSYYGPYSSAHACHETVDFIEKNFRLRTCSDHELANRVRPCLQHQIQRCDAPCVGLIDEANYHTIVDQVHLFLKGKRRELLEVIREEMKGASEREEFEKAAQRRDLLFAIESTLEQQKTDRHTWIDQDAIGLYREGSHLTACLLMIRGGKISESKLYQMTSVEEDEDLLSEFLNRLYGEGRIIPEEVLLPFAVGDSQVMEEVLSERRGYKVSILSPQRGEKRDLVRLAIRNAEEGFRQREKKVEETGEILEGLQQKLKLTNLPRKIECFDISNISGQQAVGSLACFLEGQPYKGGYRRFRIKRTEGPDDFQMMKEVLTRRLLRGGIKASPEEKEKWGRPDLMIIDGGKGQLNIVLEVMGELNVTGIDLIALAKAKEGESADKVYLPARKNPVRLKSNSSLLHLLMRVRDEAHRFALSYHKKIRGKEFLS
ncbi:MAG: excinuclease ABC subunit UvrC [Deltaproteobacteria bacterium]|nr:excinuclease ABC subunit UvrC [Deltaproteobacteria bacterium]MBI2500048.1 excinuclease ABC subunit UvrC [Deltaproteobacteria bacterium]